MKILRLGTSRPSLEAKLSRGGQGGSWNNQGASGGQSVAALSVFEAFSGVKKEKLKENASRVAGLLKTFGN